MFDLSRIKAHQRIQVHTLKSHAASNLNRDDLGRPKEVEFGGSLRLRLSSQSIKYAIRKGEIFQSLRDYLRATYGCSSMVRTTHVTRLICDALQQRGLDGQKAIEGAQAVLAALSKADKADAEPSPESARGKRSARQKDFDELRMASSQILALSVAEIEALADHLAAVEDKSAKDWAASALKPSKELKGRQIRIGRGDLSPEIALFGRMVTSDLFSNVDSPLQVAHAYTIHRAHEERDYWTAVDDYREDQKLPGSGMIDVRKFGAGVYYHYACIDVDLLVSNLRAAHAELDGARILSMAQDILNAFLLAFAVQNPTGHQNSFASHALADMMMIEVGAPFPHSAAAAYECALTSHENGYTEEGKERFRQWLDARKRHYGQTSVGNLYTLGLRPQPETLNDIVLAATSKAVAGVQQAPAR